MPDGSLESGQEASVDATVEYLDLEGGCWALKVNDVHYQPVHLGAEFRKAGLEVRATVRRRDDMMGIGMIAPFVDVLSIRAR